MQQIRRYFEQHGDSRFSIIKNGHNEDKIINRAGYKKMIDNTWHYFVLPESFKTDICSGFDVQLANAILVEKKWLQPDSEGKSTRAENLPCSKTTVRCYRFDGSKIFSDEI